ncbi:MAG: hypothetical protein AVDCRST_MAG87-1092, partial [uncultured Thermomicrobiales bacterium]
APSPAPPTSSGLSIIWSAWPTARPISASRSSSWSRGNGLAQAAERPPGQPPAWPTGTT